MSSQKISFFPQQSSNSEQELLSRNETSGQQYLKDDFLHEKHLSLEVPESENFIEQIMRELQQQKESSQDCPITHDDDNTLAATFGEEIDILNHMIPSKDCKYISKKVNDSIESHAKLNSNIKKTAELSHLQISQLSTNNMSNYSIQDDDDEDVDDYCKQQENQIDQNTQFIQQQWKPPQQSAQYDHTERSRSRKNKKEKANSIPKIELKNITQLYICECGARYDNASAIQNHIKNMKQQKDSREHRKISRDVCHGRPKEIKDQEIKELLQKYDMSSAIPGTEEERQDKIRSNLQKFQDTINEKKNLFSLDKNLLEQLQKEKMRLRKLFSQLSDCDADTFIEKFIIDTIIEQKNLEPNRVY